jgi:hypothetical protein
VPTIRIAMAYRVSAVSVALTYARITRKTSTAIRTPMVVRMRQP